MCIKKYVRSVVVFEDHFIKFKKGLDKNVIKKIYQVLILVMTLEVIPSKFMKSISSVPGLYEIRVEESGNTYRIFCCFDEGQLVVLFNGIQKKSQKTPKKDIEKAASLMAKYFKNQKSHEEERN